MMPASVEENTKFGVASCVTVGIVVTIASVGRTVSLPARVVKVKSPEIASMPELSVDRTR